MSVNKKEAKAPKINWSALKTNIIVAFVFVTAGLIGGYFMSSNIINDTQSDVISTMQAAANVVTTPKAK